MEEKIIKILDESEGDIEIAVKRLKKELKMGHFKQGLTYYFVGDGTKIIVVLDVLGDYHIYQKQKQGSWGL